MPQLRTIEIDFDIHKQIEAARKSFDEPPYIALRRLLRLPPPVDEPFSSEPETPSGRSWAESKVELPHGTLLRMEYNRGKQIYEGKIINGKWVVNGRTFDSPSGAASELALTKKGRPTKLNGWLYWKVKRPGEAEWKLLRDLRPEVKPPKENPYGLDYF